MAAIGWQLAVVVVVVVGVVNLSSGGEVGFGSDVLG